MENEQPINTMIKIEDGDQIFEFYILGLKGGKPVTAKREKTFYTFLDIEVKQKFECPIKPSKTFIIELYIPANIREYDNHITGVKKNSEKEYIQRGIKLIEAYVELHCK